MDQFGLISAGFLFDDEAERVPKEDNIHTYEDCEPSTLFREFAAECAQLAQTAPTHEKRTLYMRMASVWHQMALRWEEKG